MDFDTLIHLRDQSKFTGLARLLLFEIELFATQKSHTAFPSVSRLAHDLGVTNRARRSFTLVRIQDDRVGLV